jgi:hypothetical protein
VSDATALQPARKASGARNSQPLSEERGPPNATVAEVSTRSGAELDALIEEATVDTYDEIEAVNGFLAAIDEQLTVPFTTTVLGVEVTGLPPGRSVGDRRCGPRSGHQPARPGPAPLHVAA